jgi:hypothetical protein
VAERWLNIREMNRRSALFVLAEALARPYSQRQNGSGLCGSFSTKRSFILRENYENEGQQTAYSVEKLRFTMTRKFI